MKPQEAIKTIKGTLSLLHQSLISFYDIDDYKEAMAVAMDIKGV